MASARSDKGTTWGSAPSFLPVFILDRGTVHVLAAKSISSHRAPSASLVRAAVNKVNSSAFADTEPLERRRAAKALALA